MIKKLLGKLKELTTVPKVEPVIELDTNNIYVQFRLVLEKIGTVEIDLSRSRVGLGKINSYSPTINAFINSLLEVNHALENNEYVTKETFVLRDKMYISFDSFLFVEDNHYTQDVNQRLVVAFEQIDKYYRLINNADKHAFGPMENNHRRLYSYTQTVIEFVDALIYHFGS